MFGGIVEEFVEVYSHERGKLVLIFSPGLMDGLKKGASVSVDGVCLTVTSFEKNLVSFDLLEETYLKTTLGSLVAGSKVNVERALKMGDEIGGHLLSGHVMGRGKVEKFEKNVLTVSCAFSKYLFPKGFIAIDGISLTLVDVDLKKGVFTVHLIPETLKRTTIASKKVGDAVNIEIDIQTITIVDTTERYLSRG